MECAPAKHHYDECVERVTIAAADADNKGPKEDCVEECNLIPVPLFSFCCSYWLFVKMLIKQSSI
jgi:hypothetical protein